MKEIDGLCQWVEHNNDTTKERIKKLQEGIETVKAKRQEQTGKPYHQQ